MRIIRTAGDIQKASKEREKRRIKANIGCNVCPWCNNSRVVDIDKWNEMALRGEIPYDGKSMYIVKTTHHLRVDQIGLFRELFFRHDWYKDHYMCLNCNTEWESEIW